MCGLAGFNGPNKPDYLKLKILGDLNKSRGKHSCGVANRNLLVKGADKHKLFVDLINDKVNLNKIESGTTLIHTRHATKGEINEVNAHPYKIRLKDKDPLMFTHNGTLIELEKLGEKYNLIPDKFATDSLMLGTIIANSGIDVFADYYGAAACAFYKINEPEILYLWKGASKEYDYYKNIQEERPLHYVIHDEGMYYSSERDPLLYISAPNPEIYAVPHNTLLTFKNGKLIHKQTFERKDAYQKETKPFSVTTSNWDNNKSSVYGSYGHISFPDKRVQAGPYYGGLKDGFYINEGRIKVAEKFEFYSGVIYPTEENNLPHEIYVIKGVIVKNKRIYNKNKHLISQDGITLKDIYQADIVHDDFLADVWGMGTPGYSYRLGNKKVFDGYYQFPLSNIISYIKEGKLAKLYSALTFWESVAITLFEKTGEWPKVVTPFTDYSASKDDMEEDSPFDDAVDDYSEQSIVEVKETIASLTSTIHEIIYQANMYESIKAELDYLSEKYPEIVNQLVLSMEEDDINALRCDKIINRCNRLLTKKMQLNEREEA